MKIIKDLLRPLLRIPFVTICHRYFKFRTYNKEHFVFKNARHPFSEIFVHNYRNSPESKSGTGSTLATTKVISKKLPQLIAKYGITSMLDVPCGDFQRMQYIDLNCKYLGGDIVPELIAENQKKYTSDKVSFVELDITKDEIPQVDLIFCKDCLQHLSYESTKKALKNFKKSGSKYLLITSYPLTLKNRDIYDGDYRPLNIRKSPFHLPKPLLQIHEKAKTGKVETDKYMYFYKLDELSL